MRQSAFGRLCGISQAMVSKYAAAGLITTLEDGSIDALSSLAALEGRLDEDKRQRALATLDGSSTPSRAAADVRPTPRAAKAEREEIERDLKALELARELGEVVLVADVEATAREAIAALRETFSNGRRDIAARICAAFGIPSDRQAALARLLAQEFEEALGAFGRVMEQSAVMRAPRADAPAPALANEGAPRLI